MSALARQYNGLKAAKSKVFKPSRLQGELPFEWLAKKPTVTVDGNEFTEINLNSDDPLLLMRHSRFFFIREEAHREAREQQLKLLSTLEKENKIERVPPKWESYINDLKRGSQTKADVEYNQMAKWKVRTEELRPERDVYPYDYLWLSYAVRCKTCSLETFTRQYFPVAAVVKGIRHLAEKLLQIKDAPRDEKFYLGLCPWILSNDIIRGYPKCVTPAQAWQMFRAAGYELSSRQKERDGNTIISAPMLFGELFERFAANAQFMLYYTTHWSRVELSADMAPAPLPTRYAQLLAQSYRPFPAFRIQQAWWYAQPDKLQSEDGLEEGIYFYPVPSARHTLQAGVPALKKAMAELAGTMLWQFVVPDGELDMTTDDLFAQLSEAAEEVEMSVEAVEKVVSELRGADTPLLASKDLTLLPPHTPNELYDETYRPIMRFEIDHAQSEGITLPAWYTRRRKELATGPDKALVPDLGTTVSGTVLDFSLEEEETAGNEGEPEGGVEAEEEDENVIFKDASEDQNLPLAERLRLARLQTAINTRNDGAIETVMQAREADYSYRSEEEQREAKHRARKRLELAEGEEPSS